MAAHHEGKTLLLLSGFCNKTQNRLPSFDLHFPTLQQDPLQLSVAHQRSWIYSILIPSPVVGTCCRGEGAEGGGGGGGGSTGAAGWSPSQPATGKGKEEKDDEGILVRLMCHFIPFRALFQRTKCKNRNGHSITELILQFNQTLEWK
ncbi:hypothetical protein AAC387_Pa03g1329 [Persea americana]